MKSMTKNRKKELFLKGFIQAVVWRDMIIETQEEVRGFEERISKALGAPIVFAQCVVTNPDKDNYGNNVPGTGGRNDLIFLIHLDDHAHFSIKRSSDSESLSWFEDMVLNDRDTYPLEIQDMYFTWQGEVRKNITKQMKKHQVMKNCKIVFPATQALEQEVVHLKQQLNDNTQRKSFPNKLLSGVQHQLRHSLQQQINDLTADIQDFSSTLDEFRESLMETYGDALISLFEIAQVSVDLGESHMLVLFGHQDAEQFMQLDWEEQYCIFFPLNQKSKVLYHPNSTQKQIDQGTATAFYDATELSDYLIHSEPLLEYFYMLNS